MNSVISAHTLFAPHLHENPQHTPPRAPDYTTSPMAGRKRKADSAEPNDDRMSTSPTASPSAVNRVLPPAVRPKRHRTQSTPAAQPLHLPRLLETLTASDLRSILTNLCTSHPTLTSEILTTSPRPGLDSVLSVLSRYEASFTSSFPFGTRPESEYSYLRVRPQLHALLDALKDYTSVFLPPREIQATTSLQYLDNVTGMLGRVPHWDAVVVGARREMDEAWEELDAAWTCVVREAGKRAGGMALQLGGWEERIVRHNVESGGRVAGAVDELRRVAGWYAAGGNAGVAAAQVPASSSSSTGGGLVGLRMESGGAGAEERERVRRELLSGMYGAEAGGGGGDGSGRYW